MPKKYSFPRRSKAGAKDRVKWLNVNRPEWKPFTIKRSKSQAGRWQIWRGK